jgi:predicted DNA-binding protein
MTQRTQVYLSDEQRARIDGVAAQRGTTMAEVIRLAIDSYLDSGDDLDATFGAAPGFGASVPDRDEWQRG